MNEKPAIKFRSMEPGDGPDIRALYDLVQTAFARESGDEAVIAFVRSHIAEVFASDLADPWGHYSMPGHSYWLAEVNEELVGMAGVERWPGVPGVARLRHVMVDPAWQRNGIASTILGAAETWCAEHGYNALRLATTHLNVVALGIYRGRGYAEVGREPGRVATTFVMEKHLTPQEP